MVVQFFLVLYNMFQLVVKVGLVVMILVVFEIFFEFDILEIIFDDLVVFFEDVLDFGENMSGKDGDFVFLL